MYGDGLRVLEDFQLYKGESQSYKIDITQDGRALDISTMTVKMYVMDMEDEDIIHIEKTGENHNSEGYSIIEFVPSDTENLYINKYRYMVKVIYSTGRTSIGKGYLLLG